MIEDFFNWNNIAIKVYGDTKAARERAVSLGNKLMFQTKMLNVNNLDIIHGGMKCDDGTIINVNSQHGLDTMEVYVPPLGDVEPKYRERREITYMPAWEAYTQDNDDECIGYILARGGGWKPPYEFVKKQADDIIDIFEFGQWLYHYEGEDRPFDLDEFLEPKLMLRESRRELWEIPPHGTVNRVFEGLTSGDTYERTLNSSGFPTNFECCYFISTNWYGFTNGVADSSTMVESASYQTIFTMGAAGELGAYPEYTESGGNYFIGYDVFEETLDVPATQFVRNESDLKTFTYAHGTTAHSSCETAKEAHEGSPWFWTPENLMADYIAEDLNLAAISVKTNLLTGGVWAITIDGVAVVDEYTWDWESICTKEIKYWDFFSSALSVDKYAIAYAARDITLGAGDSFSFGSCPTVYQVTGEEYFPDDRQKVTSSQAIEAVLSDSVFQIGDYSGDTIDAIFDDSKYLKIPIRYYTVDGIQFMLGTVLLDKNPTNSRYFYADKRGDNTYLNDTEDFDSDSRFYFDLEDVTYEDEAVRIPHKFRLVKEEKIIKEKLNLETGLWEEI